MISIFLESPEFPIFLGWLFLYGDNTLDNIQAAEFSVIAGDVEVPVLRRTTGIVRDSARVTGIVDPDGTTVSFGYGGVLPNQVTSRTDGRGTVTSYAYDGGQAVRQVSTDMGVGQEPIVTGFVSTATRGLVAAEDTAGAYSLLDGPRTDVADTTRFWLDRFGQPVRIADALDNETTIAREDSVFPLLATEVVSPLGFVSRATYDERGNVDTTTTISGADIAVTTFEWDGTFDFVTKITLPEGEITEIAYDPVNGNRLFQQDGRGDSTRVTFDYYDGKNKTPLGLLRTVTSPLSGTTTVTYGNQGNLHTVTDPLGFVTTMHKDAFGRDTLVVSPIDATHDQAQRVFYDIMGRVDSTITIGPVLGAAPAESLFVANTYDAVGNPLTVIREGAPNPNNYLPVVSRFSYDNANRMVTEEQFGRTDSTVYDQAGNVVRTVSSGGDTLLLRYDPLNRLTRRVVPGKDYAQSGCAEHGMSVFTIFCADSLIFPLYPNNGTGLRIAADTARLAYDAAGNILTADNRYARIARTYNPNGTLATDSTRIRKYADSTSAAAFATHVYGLSFTYDLNGRRETFAHPNPLAPPGAGSQVYSYAPHGALGMVQSVLGDDYGFSYDAEGRLRELAYPGGTETRSYDNGGRLVRRSEQAAFLLRSDSMTYDSRGRMLEIAQVGSPTNFWAGTVQYSGLGHLVFSLGTDAAGQALTEEFAVDPQGNRVFTASGLGSNEREVHRVSEYDALGRLVRVVGQHQDSIPPLTFFPDTTYRIEDDNGNVRRQGSRQNGWDGGTGPDQNTWNLREATESYYAADQKLMFHQVYRDSLDGEAAGRARDRHGIYEEYWYDALGRRVLKRARSETLCGTGGGILSGERCLSTIERFVWDGDQLLYETRYPGGAGESDIALDRAPPTAQSPDSLFGWLGYTHGPGIDVPLGIIRLNHPAEPFVVIPHYNYRGVADAGTDRVGNRVGCAPGQQFGCNEYGWPGIFGAAFLDANHTDDGATNPPVWLGSLVQNQRDQSGLMYRRNRYYDPKTGQFTQQDPMGLGGGLNLYGFASGDPANFSDPFGLNPCLVAPKLCDIAIGAVSGALFDAGVQVAMNFAFDRPVGEGVIGAAIQGAAVGAAVGGVGMLVRGFRGTRVARSGVTGAAQGAKTVLRQGDPMLAVVHGGKVITQTSDIALSHADFVQRALGQLPGGAQVVTIGKRGDDIIALNSRTFHGNQLPASDEVMSAIKAVFR